MDGDKQKKLRLKRERECKELDKSKNVDQEEIIAAELAEAELFDCVTPWHPDWKHN